jgi:hypothetical protein
MPYRRAADLLGEILPLQDSAVAQSTVRRHTLEVGSRLDERVLEQDEYNFPFSQRLPVPSRTRLTIAIDGTYIRSDRISGLTQHYVVAGRIEADGQLRGTLAWVAQTPDDARLYLRSALQTNGWTAESRVAILADGADGLTNLVQDATHKPSRAIRLVPHQHAPQSDRTNGAKDGRSRGAIRLGTRNHDSGQATLLKVPNVEWSMG